jgi:hypothetical protein
MPGRVAALAALLLALFGPGTSGAALEQAAPENGPADARSVPLGEAVTFGAGHSVTVQEVEREVSGELGMMGASAEETAAVLRVEICAGSEPLPGRVAQGGNFGLWLPRGKAAEVHRGHSGSGITWEGEATFDGGSPAAALEAGRCVAGPIAVPEPPGGGGTAVVFDTRPYQDDLPAPLVLHLAWSLPTS